MPSTHSIHSIHSSHSGHGHQSQPHHKGRLAGRKDDTDDETTREYDAPTEESFNPFNKRKTLSKSGISVTSRATVPVGVILEPGVPRGIVYLVVNSRLFLTQNVEIVDGLTSICDRKRIYYNILDKYGRLLYRAYESRSTSCFTSIKNIAVIEPDGSQIIKLRRKLTPFGQSLVCSCPPLGRIARVKRKGCCSSSFLIKDALGETTIVVRRTQHEVLEPYRSVFELRSEGNRNVIGKITGEWLDLPYGVFESDKIYGVEFPEELHYKVKLGIFTAWILIYKFYFEGKVGRVIHHDLTQTEKDLVAFIEDK